MSQIEKILIANRGEITVRIIKTARLLGISTVAVYSEVDRNAIHVQEADEAYLIGPAPSNQSYLNIPRIIDVARKSGAQAIHPGYGFLSENAEFAEAIDKAGLIFIGPSAHAIRVMGSKLAAKDAVKPLGVPMVPGTDTAVTDVNEALKSAVQVGYPILIKASAGGGGKGMRIVEKEADLEEQMTRAISEAKSAFGDGSVFIEKYIERPRHIEVQVLFDSHGNGIYLFDRECSIQRRHQKVIEEAPANDIPEDVRRAMGEAAIKVGQSVQYTGAGTVEFLVDKHYNFYFLEMNTRLQVEHPVTELVTGIDLVEQQIRVAEGKKLAYEQSDLSCRGHAIELRVYAEDPGNQFLPSTGTLERYSIPAGDGIRVDDGYKEGQEIPIYYDPMIAKLISYGANRKEAINRLIQGIKEYHIEGVETTLKFGEVVLKHPEFQSGKYSTNFVSNYFNPDSLTALDHPAELIARIGKEALMHERNQVHID